MVKSCLFGDFYPMCSTFWLERCYIHLKKCIIIYLYCPSQCSSQGSHLLSQTLTSADEIYSKMINSQEILKQFLERRKFNCLVFFFFQKSQHDVITAASVGLWTVRCATISTSWQLCWPFDFNSRCWLHLQLTQSRCWSSISPVSPTEHLPWLEPVWITTF